MNKHIISYRYSGKEDNDPNGAGTLYLNGYLCEVVYRKKADLYVIENGSAGVGHSAYANIDETGSVEGMFKLGYWKVRNTVVKDGGFIYNKGHVVISDALDALAYVLEKTDLKMPKSGTGVITINLDGNSITYTIEKDNGN